MFRQSRCSPAHRLNYIESAMGLFHLQIQALAMLFRTHLGEDGDSCSLVRWISELNRDKGTLWNGQRNLVKDFRSFLGFWEILADGYFMASLTTYSGFDTLAEFRKAIAEDADAADQLLNTIKKFAADLASFSLVYNLRQSPETERDRIYENHLLFLQHAMMLRN